MKALALSLFLARMAAASVVFNIGVNPALGQPVPALDVVFKPVVTRLGGFGSAVAVQPDGKIIVAGKFNAINGVARSGLARLNADGTVDPAFDPGLGACCGTGIGVFDTFAPVSAMAVQADGKVVIAGYFTSVQGATRNGLARLNSNGSLDASFDSGAGVVQGQARSIPPVSIIIVLPDGKLLLGGYFTSVGGAPRNGIARLNSNGSVDETFNPGPAIPIDDPLQGGGQLTALALLGNGQIIVGGTFKIYNEALRNGLVRLNANGSLDAPWEPYIAQLDGDKGPPTISGLAVQPDGKIVLTGSFNWIDVETRIDFGRIKPDGTLDTTFQGTLNVEGGETMMIVGSQADGKIMVLRNSRTLARLNVDGTPDASFSELLLEAGEGNRFTVSSLARQADGKWLVAGSLSPSGEPSRQGFVRTTATGGVDGSFKPEIETSEAGAAQIFSVAAQRDGKVLIGGSFDRVNGTPRNRLARLNRDGSLDSAFAPALQSDEPQSGVSAIVVQDDGKILVGGLFRGINDASRSGLARLNEDGSVDATFDPGTGAGGETPALVNAFSVQTDGKIWIAGDFATYNSVPIRYLARLESNGALDLGFNIGFREGPDFEVPTIRGIAPLDNGRMLFGGTFSRVNVFMVSSLARALPDGTLDNSFASPHKTGEEATAFARATNGVSVVALTASDELGLSKTRLFRFKADGSLDADFKPEEITGDSSGPAAVSAIALRPDGSVIIGGTLTKVGSTARRGLARLNMDGTLDTAFEIGQGFGTAAFETPRSTRPIITSIALQDDGGIVVAGNYGLASGQLRLGLTRFQVEASGPPPPNGSRPRLLSPARAANGAFSFSLSGEAGRTYRIETSSDLRTWTSLGTVNGAATPQPFTDPGATGLGTRFYRAKAE